jgi:hypothetical protein
MPDTGDRAATDLTALYREAFELIRDAIDLPLAAFEDDAQRAELLQRRADAVWGAVNGLMRDYPAKMIREEIDHLRARIDQLPVLYRRYIGTAKDHPDDCQVCGPDCCRPFLGIHGSAPGPRSGEMAVTR